VRVLILLETRGGLGNLELGSGKRRWQRRRLLAGHETGIRDLIGALRSEDPAVWRS
jgi:hypothetical protein